MNNNKTVPELRFPEFMNAGEWEYLNGNVMFEPITNKNHNSDLPILAITQEHGAIPRNTIDYNVFVTDKSVQSYKVVEIGDFIISLRSFQGGIEYSNYKGICSPAYIILRKKMNLIDMFFKPFFKTDSFIQELNKDIEGIRDGKMVSYKQFSDILLPAPTPPEQQKIADCLSSLDEVIEGHEEKLLALQEHKRGLMQNLFPQEGKTKPKYRFPEFENDGEWEEKKLGELAKRITLKNNKDKISRVLTNSAAYGIVDQRDYFDKDIANKNNLTGYFIIQLGDYVYNPRASNIAPVGPISKNKIEKGVMSPLYTVFRFNSNINDFYEQYFKSKHWHQYLRMISNTGARHDRMSITSADFMNMPVPNPHFTEQQKIADCLSSLDNLITEQIERIEQLKQHKRGLMQGLFPKIEE